MIAKEFEDFLLAHLDNYLIPSDQVTIFIDSHNADHVVLLLTSNGYSRVPVLTKDKHYLGTVSLADIKRYQDEHNLQEWEMVNRDIGPMTSDVVATVKDDANLSEVMHKLVDNPFLAVVDSQGIFKGIITRKSILKAVTLANSASTRSAVQEGRPTSAPSLIFWSVRSHVSWSART